MKNFISFLIVLIFAAVVFAIGWTQIRVKPGYIGIVESKTGGVDTDIIIPGNFSWHKEFLLPTNARINIFENKPYTTTKTISAKRSAELEYSFSFQITLSYIPELIVDLMQDNTISNQEDLTNYVDGICAYIAQRCSEYYLLKFQQDSMFIPESVTISELTNFITLYKEYPDFEVDLIALTSYTYSYTGDKGAL